MKVAYANFFEVSVLAKHKNTMYQRRLMVRSSKDIIFVGGRMLSSEPIILVGGDRD